MLAGEGLTLLGCDWIQHVRLDWPSDQNYKRQFFAAVTTAFEAIFKEELGTFTGDKVTIHIDSSVVPKFCKARPSPYSIKEVVEKELQRLENLGVIKPVKSLKWAIPIISVLKSDRKSIRICGNYKLRAQGFKVRAIPNT